MASVYNRGTKDRPNWWVKYTDPSGETKRKRTGQPTKKLAEQYSAEITARLARGLIGIPAKETVKKSLLTVGQLLERFLVEYRSPQVRNIEKYLRHCASAYRARIKPYRLANIAAEKVRPSDVEGLRDELIDDGYSAKSINDAFFVLSVAYKWAIRREVLNARNPMPDVPRMRTNELDERLTLDQVWRRLSLSQAMYRITPIARLWPRPLDLPAGWMQWSTTLASWGRARSRPCLTIRCLGSNRSIASTCLRPSACCKQCGASSNPALPSSISPAMPASKPTRAGAATAPAKRPWSSSLRYWRPNIPNGESIG